MNRFGFPLLVSTGLVLGMLLAPQPAKAPVRDGGERPALVRAARVPADSTIDVVARVVEGFLVDAQGTEREIVTRVCLTPDEHASELPWRVRAELQRSRELLGWAVPVAVEASGVAWPEAPLSSRWQDASGHAVLLSVDPQDGDGANALVQRYAAALEALCSAARPVDTRGARVEDAGVAPRAGQDGADEPLALLGTDETIAWLDAVSARNGAAQAQATPRVSSVQQWVDRDGIEHRVRLDAGASALDPGTLVAELLARYPARETAD